MKVYLLIKTNALVVKEQYRLLFDRKELIETLKKEGWSEDLGEIRVSDKPGMMSMFACGDIDLRVVPFEVRDPRKR